MVTQVSVKISLLSPNDARWRGKETGLTPVNQGWSRLYGV